MIRKSLLSVVLVLLIMLLASSLSLAGSGLKIETEGLSKYTVVGLDLEIGLPGLPVRVFADLVGWWQLEEEQTTNAQAGAGARVFFTQASSGPFIEGKFRYVFQLDEGFPASTNAIIVGAGYRLRVLFGNADISIQTCLTEHELIPKYFIGARIGF